MAQQERPTSDEGASAGAGVGWAVKIERMCEKVLAYEEVAGCLRVVREAWEGFAARHREELSRACPGWEELLVANVAFDGRGRELAEKARKALETASGRKDMQERASSVVRQMASAAPRSFTAADLPKVLHEESTSAVVALSEGSLELAAVASLLASDDSSNFLDVVTGAAQSVWPLLVKTCSSELLADVSVKGITDTPVGRTGYTVSGLSLTAFDVDPRDVEWKTHGYLFDLAVKKWTASTAFSWSYELDTGLGFVRDSGTGVCTSRSGSLSVSFEVVAAVGCTGTRVALRSLKHQLGVLDIKIGSPQNESNRGDPASTKDGLYNRVVSSLVDHVQLLVDKKTSTLVPKLADYAIRFLNDVLESKFPHFVVIPPNQTTASDLRDFFDSDGFL